MFASRTMACAEKDSELHVAAYEALALLIEALEAPAVGLLRERHALQVWAALHGVVMLAEQGLLTGQVAQITREELVEDIVQETKMALTLAIEKAGGAGSATNPHPEEHRKRCVAKDGPRAASGPHGSRRPRAGSYTMRVYHLPIRLRLRRPRIDRRGAAHAQDILQHLCAREQLAPRRAASPPSAVRPAGRTR